MKRLRITSDGSGPGTVITDDETGETLDNVIACTWRVACDEKARIELEVDGFLAPTEISGDLERAMVAGHDELLQRAGLMAEWLVKYHDPDDLRENVRVAALTVLEEYHRKHG